MAQLFGGRRARPQGRLPRSLERRLSSIADVPDRGLVHDDSVTAEPAFRFVLVSVVPRTVSVAVRPIRRLGAPRHGHIADRVTAANLV